MYGIGNEITLYKGRKINVKEPVYIYRNLNKKGIVYTIKQFGLIVGHTTCIGLKNVEFVINKSEQNRAKKNNQRNVHAFIKGKIALNGLMGTTAKRSEELNYTLPAKIVYNLKKYNKFICVNLTKKAFPVKNAMGIIFNKYGVYASYIS